MSDLLDLAIVVPVFNEEYHINALISDWAKIFKNNRIRYRFIVVNDGSSDKSVERLESLQRNSYPIEIISQSNQGHGTAILNGYTRALTAAWVFQIDADHQLDVSAFAALWEHRENYDLLLAERVQKNATPMRNVISATSRTTVQLFFGKGVRDVNSPYRLFRSPALAEAIANIPAKSFAPNTLLTAYFVFKQARIYLTTVPLRTSSLIRKSKMSFYLFSGSLQSLFQIIAFRFKL